MDDMRSNIEQFRDLAKLLNRDTQVPSDSKVKPKVPSSHLRKETRPVRRERKVLTSELWLG